MNMLVSTAIAGSAVTAVAAQPIDPIYAAIEAHKVAAAGAVAAQRRFSDFENELQANGRLWKPDRTDDETRRTEEIEAAIEEAHHAEQVEAYALLDVNPTTMAGVIALLTYACDHDDTNDAMGWPEAIGLADEPGSRSWQYFLMQNLTEILPKLVPVSA